MLSSCMKLIYWYNCGQLNWVESEQELSFCVTGEIHSNLPRWDKAGIETRKCCS